MSWETKERTSVGNTKVVLSSITGSQTASAESTYTTDVFNISGSKQGTITFIITSISTATSEIMGSTDNITFTSLPIQSYTSITASEKTEVVSWSNIYKYLKFRVNATGGDCVINNIYLLTN
jgi:hypothetical protein